MITGKCMLTYKHGRFVDAHIVPKAFTRPIGNQKFIQGGRGQRIFRNPSSWYDGKLVIRQGEDILRDIDDAAIRALRKAKLVWSGWGQNQSLVTADADLLNGFGVRQIPNLDTSMLRKFILSILWRAAASRRTEFSNVVLAPEIVEELRLMLLGQAEIPLSRLPVHFTQLSTIGPRHNLAPLHGSEIREGEAMPPVVMHNAYRFYFDGLIAYVCLELTPQEYEDARYLFAGESRDLLTMCVPFEQSWQYHNLLRHISESQQVWPNDFSKLTKS